MAIGWYSAEIETLSIPSVITSRLTQKFHSKPNRANHLLMRNHCWRSALCSSSARRCTFSAWSCVAWKTRVGQEFGYSDISGTARRSTLSERWLIGSDGNECNEIQTQAEENVRQFQELSNSRRQLIGIDDLKANYAARALHIAAAQCKSVRAAKRI